MNFQMSEDGNWIVSTDLDGMDIKLEQVSFYLDPASLNLRWKKTVDQVCLDQIMILVVEIGIRKVETKWFCLF